MLSRGGAGDPDIQSPRMVIIEDDDTSAAGKSGRSEPIPHHSSKSLVS